jgi:hypothetical protein
MGSLLKHVPERCPKYRSDQEADLADSVNIQVYKNGEHRATPYLIHFPAKSLQCMGCVIEKIAERMSFGIGYPEHLYHLDGKPIEDPEELIKHGSCVVASNLDKYFHDVPYSKYEPGEFVNA